MPWWWCLMHRAARHSGQDTSGHSGAGKAEQDRGAGAVQGLAAVARLAASCLQQNSALAHCIILH